jgi:hypothetical protein
MCRQNHGVAVDYFAVGIMAYEFMMGRVSKNMIMCLTALETISRTFQKGNQRSDFGKTSPNQET